MTLTNLDPLLRTFTDALLPDSAVAVRRRQGVIDAVNAGPPPTVDVTIGGLVVPGVAYLASYSPTAGDVVFVDLNGSDPLVIGAAEPAGDTGWQAPTLLNGWVSYDSTYGPPKYRRRNGIVYIKGLVKNGTLSTAIFILPAGYRPGGVGNTPILLFTVEANGGHGRIDVDGTTGAVVATPGSATFTSLNGIVFIAEG